MLNVAALNNLHSIFASSFTNTFSAFMSQAVVLKKSVNSLGLLVLLAGGLGGCAEKAVAPAAGNIETTILPAGQVTAVVATAANGQTYSTTPDANTGLFRFPTLPAGTYVLTFTTTTAYKTPLPVSVPVTAGATATPRLSALTRDHKLRGTLTWQEGGATYQAVNLYGEVSDSFVSIDGYVATAGAGHEIGFVLPGDFRGTKIFQGVGTYPVGGQEYPFASYTYTPGRDTWMYFTPFAGSATGKVTITRYDKKAFIIAGTFEYEAQPFSNPTGMPGTAKITQGSFELTY